MIAALCRGTGLNGLGGMPWRRRLNSSTALIRPMLAVRRSECEDFCRAARIEWRDDPSNRDVSRMRARLRRDVLPVLEELWPDSPRRAAATADAVRVARRIVNRRVAHIFGNADVKSWDRSTLQQLPVPLIATGLRRAAMHVQPESHVMLRQSHLRGAAEFIASDDKSPREFQWPGDLKLKVTSKQITLNGTRRKHDDE
jgi:tRNA(Ile)-lysidine synthase TilS/MesJ